MRLLTPEISWHETLPIYSCDLQPIGRQASASDTRPVLGDISLLFNGTPDEAGGTPTKGKSLPAPETKRWTRLATCGGDSVVRLWRFDLDRLHELDAAAQTKGSIACLTFLASLRRHEKPVNVVRWSNSGTFLASGSDDSLVIIWQRKKTGNEPEAVPAPSLDHNEEENEEARLAKETWQPVRTLRRHLEDVYDLSWSPDDRGLLSGSVDRSAILWQVDLAAGDGEPEAPAGQTPKALILREAKHYVQGVAWDPSNAYLATLSCDRALRLYSVKNKTCLSHITKYDKQHLFQDDSWKSFFRRLAFSPDGLLLACPSGHIQGVAFASPAVGENAQGAAEENLQPQHAVHVMLRSSLGQPVVSFPTGAQPAICVRFCPRPFRLRGPVEPHANAHPNLIDLPYRWIFCLVLEDSLLLCDTQHAAPFAHVSQIHYQGLNDACWSADGTALVVCSTDGYCSILTFTEQELGPLYPGPVGLAAFRLSEKPQPVEPPPSEQQQQQPEEKEEPAPVDAGVKKSEAQPQPTQKRRVALVTLTGGEETKPATTGTPKRRVSIVTLSSEASPRVPRPESSFPAQRQGEGGQRLRVLPAKLDGQTENESDCTLGDSDTDDENDRE